MAATHEEDKRLFEYEDEDDDEDDYRETGAGELFPALRLSVLA